MTNLWRKTNLLTISLRFELKDIYNAGEFGLFYQVIPTMKMELQANKCVGGKSRTCVISCNSLINLQVPF